MKPKRAVAQASPLSLSTSFPVSPAPPPPSAPCSLVHEDHEMMRAFSVVRVEEGRADRRDTAFTPTYVFAQGQLYDT